MYLAHVLATRMDDQGASQIYTVRELVDALLQARNPGASSPSALPGWDVILESEPDDSALSILAKPSARLALWFLVAKVISLLSQVVFRLRVSGREKLPQKGPFILCPNHQSFLDAPVILSQMPWRL